MRAIALLLLLLASPVYAQEPTPLKLPIDARPVAARISDYTLVAAATIRVRDAWHDADRTGAFIELGCEAGLTMGVIEVLKRVIHRTRPDGSDDHSMPSGHTGMAGVLGGWPLAAPVSVMRQMAWKHYLTDTIVGFGVAFLSTKVCR